MGEARTSRSTPLPTGPERCRAKFLSHFPGGFRDPTYLAWERDYKWAVHKEWQRALGEDELRALLIGGEHDEIASRALRVEQRSRHSMLFSFEKMGLRDALRTREGARAFAEGLYDLLHGKGPMRSRFDAWRDVVASLPRRKTRVLTWPVVTVFPAIAQPKRHVFVKPNATKRAAAAYGHDLPYASRPAWETYRSVLDLAAKVRRDQADLGPRDMIDAQSFLWVQGSDEY